MSFDEIGKVFLILLKYLLPTLKVFGMTLLFSIPLGMIVALLKMCKVKPVSWLMNIYIMIMRGTPLMLQVIIAYFAIPMLMQNAATPAWLNSLLSGVDIKGDAYMFRSVLVAFSLNYAAYFAEIFRGGIESIPKGQYEASACLGFSRTQTFFRIILPQVFKRVLPASTNEIITLVKDTSLANVVAYAEITMKAKQQMQLYSSLTPLVLAGVMYFVLAMVLSLLSSFIEKKLSYYK
ncbi:MAG: amino acid ABC transporter permease [Oscillospiraceae bacterium]|nr:amino acid ABC transporter permease [Oscillospiraceae bacterium]